MALNKVEICGVNTSTLPVLKQEEKEELFKRIKAGDNEARELYIKGNLRLVLSVIRRFQNSSPSRATVSMNRSKQCKKCRLRRSASVSGCVPPNAAADSTFSSSMA